MSLEERVTFVDGREIRWRTAGSGSPTVVLDAGLSASASQWTAIQPRLAATTRVVAVSRAGYGGSTPTPARSADASVADLAAVLEEVEGPLVLVGHSWGGMLCRLYAATHPERVAGVVLVDATHEGIAPMRAWTWRLLAGVGMRMMGRKARSGAMRADLEAGRGPYASPLASMPAEARPALVDELCEPAPWRQASRDVRAVQRLLKDLDERPRPLPGVPVVAVVGAGEENRSRRLIRDAYDAWLPTLPDGRLVLAPRSGHMVPHEDEDLLVQVVEDLVTEVRSSRRTTDEAAV